MGLTLRTVSGGLTLLTTRVYGYNNQETEINESGSQADQCSRKRPREVISTDLEPRYKANQWRKDSIYSKWYRDIWKFMRKKMSLDKYLSFITNIININSK